MTYTTFVVFSENQSLSDLVRSEGQVIASNQDDPHKAIYFVWRGTVDGRNPSRTADR